MTVRDLIREASILCGAQDPYEDTEAQEADYGLSKVNQFIDILATDRLSMHRRQRTGPFTLPASVASYTIGAGGTWSVGRPLWIDGAAFLDSTSEIETDIEIYTLDAWRATPAKTLTSPRPMGIFYDRIFNSSGYGIIYPWPIPSATGQIILYLPIAVSEFSSLDDVIALPHGYRMMLVSNLAKIMAIGVVDLPPEVSDMARESLGSVRGSNVVDHMDPLGCDNAVLQGPGGGGFNWLTGGFR